MKVRVDRTRCVGSGLCVMTAPAVFDQTEDGLVALRDSGSGPERADADRGAFGGAERERVEEAEEICPARAIAILPR